MFEYLLKPGRIGTCEIKNRFVMPSMGSGHSQAGGMINEETIEYYCERARGGFGLIVAEFSGVDVEGLCSIPQFRIYSDDYIPVYRKLADAIHAAGAKTFLQLHHAGRVGDSAVTGKQLVSSSRIPSPVAGEPIRSLKTEEVYTLIERFGDAAARAKAAGFDGVELHGGHGYMIAQFMSAYLNKRTDEFGGDILGRAQFPVGIVRNIKEKCGEDYPVMLKLAGDEMVEGAMHLNETRVFARLLEEAGLNALTVTVGLPFAFGDHAASLPSFRFPIGFNSYSAEEIRRSVSIPVITIGRIVDPAMADTIIRDGMADFVALGRASIADPHFPRKVAEGRPEEIVPCVGCMATCITGPGTPGTTCAFNPFSGRESELKITPAEKKKRIVVAGGGLAGLEASWVLAARGHQVTLMEKEDELGGQARAASVPLHKQKIAQVIRYYITMCRKYGVDIRLRTEATAESILAVDPDAVILSTGARPCCPDVPNDGIETMQAVDILNGEVIPGRRCLVVGGNQIALETAEYLMTLHRKVTVAAEEDSVGGDIVTSDLFMDGLEKGGVTIRTGTSVTRFTSDGAVCSGRDGGTVLSGFDTAVLAIGMQSWNPLEEQLRGRVAEMYVIGDAVRPGRMHDAVREAAETAAAL